MRSHRIFLSLALAGGLGLATPGLSQSEDAAVRETVDRYLHGLKFNDVASLQSAFHSEAKLFFVRKDGSLGQLTQEQWYKGFASSAGKEEQGDLSVLTIDVTGNAASVKVREVYPTSAYTDYVSLLKLPAGWRIISKVYFAEARKTPS
jgi:protease I